MEGASTGDCGRSSFAPVYSLEHVCSRCAMGKIVTVVVCEGYVVFIVSMEIIQIKDELKEDMLKIGGYKITPKGSISLFKEIDFKIAQTEYSYTILISKKPLKWLYKKFYVTIYGRHGKVKKD